MRRLTALPFVCFFICTALSAQVGIGTNVPASSAILDLNSKTKGLLLPRVTTPERIAIADPALGLMVFDVEKNLPYYFNGYKWVPLGAIDPKNVPPAEIGSGNTTNPLYRRYRSAAMASNYAAAGMPAYDSAGINIGAVQIYKKANGKWAKSQLIIAPDTSHGAQFGYSVDMQGNYLVVGSPTKKINTYIDCGKVYVYRLNTNTGNFEIEGQITYPGVPGNYLYFGNTVAITTRSPASGGVAVAVGAPGFSGGLFYRGAVSVFIRGANGAAYPHLNTISGGQEQEHFGYSVDIDSNLLVIGCPGFDTTVNGKKYPSTGRVQINRFSGTNYNTLDGSLQPLVDTSNQYGYRVSIDSSTLIVGGYANGDQQDGQPVIYRRTGPGAYSLENYLSYIEQTFEDPNSYGGYHIMGYDLAMTPFFCIIGISHETHFYSSSSSFGGMVEYAVIYKRRQASFTHDFYSQIKAPNGQISTRFGYAVAAFRNDYMIVMPEGRSDTGDYGAVYFGTILE